MQLETAFLIVAIIYLGYLAWQLFVNTYAINNLVTVRSPINGEYYKVHAGHSNQKGAAELLSRIDDGLIKLIKAMKKNHPEMLITKRLLANYNPDKIVENTPFNLFNFTSYTINKGAMMRFCMRSKDKSAKLLPLNEMMFVAIHELGHVGAVGYGHDLDFWKTFKVLLLEAEAIGIYTPVNYALQPFEYCGMTVDSNPYFEAGL